MEKSIYAKEYRVLLKLLRETRKAAGLTQIEVSKRLGETQTFVSKCERGERRIDLLEWLQFCKAMETEPEEFLKTLKSRLLTSVDYP